MPQLELTGVCVRYGDTVAVDGVSFTLEPGEIGCLVGPSGCGKTSLLRAIAGFEEVDNGSIMLADKVASAPCWNLAPHRRSVGMLFQDFALFPHLTVAENIGFGLRGWGRHASQERIEELLALVGLDELGPRYPHELSGGQQQRTALARAIAPRPTILLLDEPFSSQDIERRAQLAQEVRHILRRENVTALLVTHDQHEAFAIADRIGVMNEGHLHQWSDPYHLYHEPADLFVADFIGHGALLTAKVLGPDRLETALGIIHGPVPPRFEANDPVYLLVRPDDILHDDQSDRTATVVNRVFRGADFLFTLGLDDGEHVLCLSPSHHDHAIGTRIGIRVEIEHLVVFSRDAGWAGVPGGEAAAG
ncbi:MAG: ABC transporter ATP-binding protein [Halofilum sp. (in: g-proteobacteria)]|nr:ABC transporter ATP-binding protein [Halofilum sp. (in: g-proteobacteria)]